jgi:hypothetical protein
MLAHRRHARPEPRQSGRLDVICFAPRTPLSGRIRIKAPQPICSPFPIGTDISKRPFARSQRKPASRPPFRGQCSRPACSISTGPSPNPFQPDVPNRLTDLRSPSGFFMPLQIVAFNRSSAPEVHLLELPDFPSLPAAMTHKCVGRGSTFQVRYFPPGPLLPCTSWNQVHHAPYDCYSQINSYRFTPFSSRR